MRYTLLVLITFIGSFGLGMEGSEGGSSPYSRMDQQLYGSRAWANNHEDKGEKEDGVVPVEIWVAPHIELHQARVLESSAGNFVHNWHHSVSQWSEADPALVSPSGQNFHLMTDHEKTAVWRLGKKWSWPRLLSIPKHIDAPLSEELLDPDGNRLPVANISSIASASTDTTWVVAHKDGRIFVWHNGRTKKPSEVLTKVKDDFSQRQTDNGPEKELPQVRVALSEYAHTLVAADFFGMLFVWKRKHNSFDLAFTHRVNHHIENIATDGKYAAVATSDNKIGLVNITCGHNAKSYKFRSFASGVQHLMLQDSLNQQGNPQLAWVLKDNSTGGPQGIRDAGWLEEEDGLP